MSGPTHSTIRSGAARNGQIHPVMGYGLAALIGAAFWASLLFTVF